MTDGGPNAWGSRDAIGCALTFVGTVLYLASLPRNLGPADEASYLHQAKRLLDGEVMYRDIFDFITPGWMYLMAILFRLFGTTITTARVAMAVLHGIAAVGIYSTCRALGVRRVFSMTAILGYLTLAVPAWPIASQHWLSTVLSVLLLWSCVARPSERPRWMLLPGVLLGLLIGVQQQRGLPMAFGTVVWLILDHGLRRRWEPTRRWAELRADLVYLIGGALAVSLPIGLVVLYQAGFGAVWDALVRFPIVNYRQGMRCTWGHVNVMTLRAASFTFPRVLAALPVVLLIPAARLLVLVTRRRREQEARALALLLCYCGASALSIAYLPDFIHIAFVAWVFIVVAAESAEWLVQGLRLRESIRSGAAALIAAILIVAAGVRLDHNRERLRRAYPIGHPTAFGRIDFADADEVRLYETVNRLVEASPGRELFCYPGLSHLYLMTGAKNPTPFTYFFARFMGPERTQRALDILRAKALPYLLLFGRYPDDPVFAFVQQEYEPLQPDDPVGQVIFRRRALRSVQDELTR